MSSVVDIYYNKEAKCSRLPWETTEEVEADRSMASLDNESTDEDNEKNESSLIGS